jgi:hypothetical protein
MHYTTFIDFKVTNENDSKAMGGMLRVAKPFWDTIILLQYMTVINKAERI